jgi:hypothetical protein
VHGGAMTDSASTTFTLVRNRLYQVVIAYEKDAYQVTVDGATLLTLDALSDKGGTFGLGSKGTATSFDFVRVE